MPASDPVAADVQTVHARVRAFMDVLCAARVREETTFELGDALCSTVERMRDMIRQQQREEASHVDVPSGRRSNLPAAASGGNGDVPLTDARKETVCAWLASISEGWAADAAAAERTQTSPLMAPDTVQRAAAVTLVASGFSAVMTHEGCRIARHADDQCERLRRAASTVRETLVEPLRDRHKQWEQDALASLLEPVLSAWLFQCVHRLARPIDESHSVVRGTEAAIGAVLETLFACERDESPRDRELAVLRSRLAQQQQRLSSLFRGLVEPPTEGVKNSVSGECSPHSGSHVLSSTTRQARLTVAGRWRQRVFAHGGDSAPF